MPLSVMGTLTVEMIISLVVGYQFEISRETGVLEGRAFAVLLLTIGGKVLL